MKIMVLLSLLALCMAQPPAARAADASIERHAQSQGATREASSDVDTSCKFGCWG